MLLLIIRKDQRRGFRRGVIVKDMFLRGLNLRVLLRTILIVPQSYDVYSPYCETFFVFEVSIRFNLGLGPGPRQSIIDPFVPVKRFGADQSQSTRDFTNLITDRKS